MTSGGNDTYKACQVFPPFPVCSGNGECDTTRGVCICKDGWSSIGDFASKDGVDCNIHIVAYKVMQAIMIVVAIISSLYTVNSIVKQMHNYKIKKGSMKGYLSDSTRLYPLWIFLMCLSAFVDGVYRFIYPLRVLGGDVFATVILTLFLCGYAFAVTNFLKIIVRFLYHYTASLPSAANLRMKREVEIVMKSSIVFNITICFIMFIPFLCFAFPDNEFEVGAAFYVSFCIWNTSAAAFCSTRGVHTMINLLEEHLRSANSSMVDNDNKLKMLLKRLKRSRNVFLSTMPLPFVGWFLFGLSRSFSRQSTYFFSYLLTNGLFVAIAAITLLPPQNTDGSKDNTPVHPSGEENKVNPEGKHGVSSANSTNSGAISPVQGNNFVIAPHPSNE